MSEGWHELKIPYKNGYPDTVIARASEVHWQYAAPTAQVAERKRDKMKAQNLYCFLNF
jgi:hypothetical protein